MSGYRTKEKQTPYRNVRKWQHHEEVSLVDFLKLNRDFERPCAQDYYKKFIFENKIDMEWKLVRCKVRNMRTAYRRVKEQEIDKVYLKNWNPEIVKKHMLKVCWYADEFDILFPNDMVKTNNYSDPILDDEFSRDESFCNVDISNKNSQNNFFAEEESTSNSFSKSLNESMSSTIEKTKFKEEKRNEELPKEKLKIRKENFCQKIKPKRIDLKQVPSRNRYNPVRKWQRNEEDAIVVFLKQNPDFEKPTARIYYTKFIKESGMHDIDFKRVRSKVRNMRTTYRKAKEQEINNVESNNCDLRELRRQVLKICWYVDEFDIVFPNEMEIVAYKQYDPTLDDEFSNDESIQDNDNSNTNVKNDFLPEEDSTTTCSFSKSKDEDILTIQRNLFNSKNKTSDEYSIIREQELELAKEKLNFEKEKLREEIRLREKEIEIEEKLKIMEFEMKERIAIKELEIEEKLALKSIEKPVNSYNNVYHNLT